MLFLIGNPGKVSKGKTILSGKLIYYTVSQEQKVVKNSNLVKLLFRSVQFFLRENQAKFFST